MSEDNLFSPDEERLIDEAFQHLIDSYLQTKHRKKVEIITKAFQFARQAHRGVRRHSGEPYIMHPLAVAQIVCSEIGLGSTSICSALLHDVVEDTDYTTDDIKNVFYIYMNPTFGYLAIILLLCLPFVFPSQSRCIAETTEE